MRIRWLSVLVVGTSIACGSGGAPDVAAPPIAAPTPVAPPAPVTPAATRCPEGVIFFETWQGEYPGPPVDVKTAVTVPARAMPCDAEAASTCTVPVGLYHMGANHDGKFGTIRATEHWKAKRATTLDMDGKPTSVAAGDVVVVNGYMGEGFCDVAVGSVSTTTECPSLLEDEGGPFFERLPEPEGTDIQLFAANCTEGRELWIDADKALFDRPEVTEGSITEYGKADHGE